MTTWSNSVKPTMNVEYLATQALKILITQDDKKIITSQSNVWTSIVKAITSWTNINK